MALRRVSIFPLGGALLYPGLHLPLHIFEPRYRALVSDALARDRLIGMIQPREEEDAQPQPGRRGPALFDIGCLGHIADVEAMEDGRFTIILEGVGLFRVARELDVTTPFRQIEAEMLEAPPLEALASVERAALEDEAKRFAVWLGYRVDWEQVAQLDDTTFVNATAQIVPFDAAAKQMLLEAPDLAARADLLMQLMRFASSRRDPDDNRATLQ